ncbi:MAG: ArsR/SmtB family transcription factor [Eubacteriales bacterium]
MLKILGHPIRLCIVNGLYKKGSCNVTYMQECLALPQSTVSQHISKLKSAGVIKGKKNGTEICYEIVDATVVKILDVLF